MCRHALAIVVATVLSGVMPLAASAQSLGTFRWQLQPYCNVLSLVVTQNAGVYEIEGTDDQCGASKAASAIGTAFLNPDGSIGFGLAIVIAPGGVAVHVDASISASTLGGTWNDSAGHSGSFVFTPGARADGSPRPLPTSGLAPGSVGTQQVNPAQVQLRIGGSCPSNAFMVGVTQTGNVTCQPAPGGITGVIVGAGLQGGGESGEVSLGLRTRANGTFDLSNVSGFFADGVSSVGGIPTSGPGTRAMWYPGKSAFRAGYVTSNQWDDVNVGVGSAAFGLSTIASGASAFAMGDRTTASGSNSTATGHIARAAGAMSVAMGTRVTAEGHGSVVLGSYATAVLTATGTFIFADRSSQQEFTGFAPNQFLVRSAGGAGIYTNSTATTGVELAPGGSAWLNLSDVNMKENFRDLEDGEVLTKIARMPIREWNYKAQDAAIRHIGPTAQDFRAAFGLGENPLRISTIDADGVALRAIQALEARTREQDIALVRENAALKSELAALRERLDRIEVRQQ